MSPFLIAQRRTLCQADSCLECMHARVPAGWYIPTAHNDFGSLLVRRVLRPIGTRSLAMRRPQPGQRTLDRNGHPHADDGRIETPSPSSSGQKTRLRPEFGRASSIQAVLVMLGFFFVVLGFYLVFCFAGCFGGGVGMFLFWFFFLDGFGERLGLCWCWVVLHLRFWVGFVLIFGFCFFFFGFVLGFLCVVCVFRFGFSLGIFVYAKMPQHPAGHRESGRNARSADRDAQSQRDTRASASCTLPVRSARRVSGAAKNPDNLLAKIFAQCLMRSGTICEEYLTWVDHKGTERHCAARCAQCASARLPQPKLPDVDRTLSGTVGIRSIQGYQGSSPAAASRPAQPHARRSTFDRKRGGRSCGTRCLQFLPQDADRECRTGADSREARYEA